MILKLGEMYSQNRYKLHCPGAIITLSIVCTFFQFTSLYKVIYDINVENYGLVK